MKITWHYFAIQQSSLNLQPTSGPRTIVVGCATANASASGRLQRKTTCAFRSQVAFQITRSAPYQNVQTIVRAARCEKTIRLGSKCEVWGIRIILYELAVKQGWDGRGNGFLW